MTDRIELSRKVPAVRRLLAATFPGYRGRKIRLAFSTTVRLENYWDGGTRSYWIAVNPVTGATSSPAAATGNPFNGIAHVDVPVPPGIVLVEHAFFCGRDAGVTFHVAPGEARLAAALDPVSPKALLADLRDEDPAPGVGR